MGFRNWIFVAFAVLGVALWVSRGKSAKAIAPANPVAHVNSSELGIVVPAARKPLQKIYSSPRPKLTEAEKDSIQASPGCSRTWDTLRTENFIVDKNLTGLSGEVLKECETPPQELKKVHAQFVKACSEFHDPEKRKEESREACLVAGLQYRGMVALRLNRDRKLEDIDDMGVLSDLMLAKLYENQTGPSGDIAPEAMRGIANVAERMMEVDTTLPLQTLVAGSRTADYLESLERGGAPSGPLKDAAARALDRVLEVEPNNKPALSAKIWVEGEGNPTKHKEAAVKARKDFPDSPVPIYHDAAADVALGNRASADKTLEEGRPQHPNEPNLQRDSSSLPIEIKLQTDVTPILAGGANAAAE